MRFETITRLQGHHEPLDFEARGAAMRLAWIWVAQDHWYERNFGQVPRDLFAQHLKKAHAHVKMITRGMTRRRLGDKDPRVIALREQRAMLENKSFNISIRQEQDRIDSEINAIINALEA